MSKPRPFMTSNIASIPWYRQAWPWGLILGPGLVVLASSYSAYLAIKTTDPMVSDDYYQQGMSINRSLARDEVAMHYGLHAQVNFQADGAVQITLHTEQSHAWPASINLQLAHPTLAEHDRHIELKATQLSALSATYQGAASGKLDSVAYRLTLQGAGDKWRLTGRMNAAHQSQLLLSPVPAAGRPVDD